MHQITNTEAICTGLIGILRSISIGTLIISRQPLFTNWHTLLHRSNTIEMG